MSRDVQHGWPVAGVSLAVLLLVQVLWMVVVGADRVANAVGIRKSPLL